MKQFGYACAAICILLLQVGCAVKPYQVTDEMRELEVAYGKSSYARIEGFFGVYKHDVLQGHIQRVGEQLAALSQRNELVYRFVVLDTPKASVFSLPGGYVYISRGLLALLNSEEQLAAVLALQVAHIASGHVGGRFELTAAPVDGEELGYYDRSFKMPGMYRAIAEITTRGYGEQQELQAYILAADYLVSAGYSPEALLEVYDLYARPIESTYLLFVEPLTDTAVSGVNFREQLSTIVRSVTWTARDSVDVINREQQFLSRLKGVRVDNNGLLYIKGNQVVHQSLQLDMLMPRNWLMVAGAGMMLAFPNTLDAYIKVTNVDNNTVAEVEEKIAMIKKQAPLLSLSEKRATVFGNQNVLYGLIESGERTYLFETSAKNQKMWEEYFPQLQEAMTTIKLSDRQFNGENVEVNELDLLVTNTQTALDALLLKNKDYRHVDSAWIRYLNQMGEQRQLEAGRYIKVTK